MKVKVRADFLRHTSTDFGTTFGRIIAEKGPMSSNLKSWAAPYLFVCSRFSKFIQCLPVNLPSSNWTEFSLLRREAWTDWSETLRHPPAEGSCFCCSRGILRWVALEMEKEHMPIRRGVSWSPGGLRKPLNATQTMQTAETECNAPWEKTGFNKEQMSRKTSKSLFIWCFPPLIWGMQDVARRLFQWFVCSVA